MEAKKAQRRNLTSATQLHIITPMDLNHCLPPNFRQTKIRHAVLGIFVSQQKPITASQILEMVKSHVSKTVNKTTIYRQLEFLHSKQLINVIEIDGTKRYQLSINSPHKLFFCSCCHHFFEVKSNDFLDQKQVDKIATDNKFKINHFLTTFFGICSECQSSK